MRTCSKCGGTNETKSQSWCSSCKKNYDKAYYSDEQKRTDQRERVRVRNERVREALHRRVIEYLSSHPCVDCGESDPVVLEFDHQEDKTDTICNLIRARASWSRVKNEIDKCEVRCANCHKRRTARQFGWRKLKPL